MPRSFSRKGVVARGAADVAMVCRAAVLVCLFSLALSATALDGDVPDAGALRAKLAAAAGDPATNYQETITYTNVSYSGTRHTYRRGEDRREVDDRGPIHSESGVAHGEHWHQDDNGHTVIELPDRTPPGIEPTTTTVTRGRATLDAYV